MRKRAEYEGRVGERLITRNELYFPPGYARLLPRLRVGRCEGKVKQWVLQHQAAELSSRVATGTQDADRKFMHF